MHASASACCAAGVEQRGQWQRRRLWKRRGGVGEPVLCVAEERLERAAGKPGLLRRGSRWCLAASTELALGWILFGDLYATT